MIKSVVYRTGLKILRSFWISRGGRHISAFGEHYHVSADTIFPNYRKFRLPKGVCLSEIVRYTDYVQLHSVVNYVSQLINKPTLVDIGAHHGAYAIILGKIVQKMGGKVVAIEPNPDSYSVLLKNINLNRLENTVTCEQVAVADKEGYMNIDLIGSESKLTLKKNDHVVKVITLEQLLKKHEINHVHLLIIDVEGAELPVLRGFPWRSVKVEKIFCELHPYAWKDFGYNSQDMRGFLNSLGYRCLDMYFQEHLMFATEAYIGPTLLIPKDN